MPHLEFELSQALKASAKAEWGPLDICAMLVTHCLQVYYISSPPGEAGLASSPC